MDPRRVLGAPPAPPKRALFRAAWLVGLLALVALLLVPAATLAAPSGPSTIVSSHAQTVPSDPPAPTDPTPTPTPVEATPTPTPVAASAAPTPTPTGTLRVCKVIEDSSGNVVSGSAWAAAPHGEFMIGDLNPAYSAWAPAVPGTFGTVMFNTGNAPNTNLPGLGDGMNAQCMTIFDLPLFTHFYYSTESITSDPNSAWQVIGYNDTFTDAISGLSTFKPYNGCLFVSPNGTDCARDLNADGDIFLGNNGVNDRTLVVLNQFRAPTPTPTPTPTPSQPATCQQSGQPCNTPTPTPVVTPTPPVTPAPTPTPVVTPSPSGSVLPTTGTPRPSGSVLTATGSPRPTLPVTSAGDGRNGTAGSTLPLFMLLIGAAVLGLFLGSPLPRKVRR